MFPAPSVIVFIADGETAVEIDVHSPLVGTAFEAVAIAVGSDGVLVEEVVLVGDAIIHDNGLVIPRSSVFLVEHVPPVVGVKVCPATVEVVAVAHGKFGCEAVGVALALVAIEVTIAVDDLVVSSEVLDLQSGVAVLVDVAFLNDVVVRLFLVGVAGPFDEQAVVAGVADVNAIEMPITAGEPHPLVGIVGMFVVGHGREVEDGPTSHGEEFDGGLLCAVLVVDVDAVVIDVGA